MHPHQQLTVARLGVGMLLKHQGAVDDRYCSHPRRLDTPGARVGVTVASVSGVSVSGDSLVIFDDEGNELVLDDDEAAGLGEMSDGFEAATVSACQECRSRVLACVALVDLLDAGLPHSRSTQLREFAEEAPTSHLFVQDLVSTCRHRLWRDPGYAEWREALDDLFGPARGVR